MATIKEHRSDISRIIRGLEKKLYETPYLPVEVSRTDVIFIVDYLRRLIELAPLIDRKALLGPLIKILNASGKSDSEIAEAIGDSRVTGSTVFSWRKKLKIPPIPLEIESIKQSRSAHMGWAKRRKEEKA